MNKTTAIDFLLDMKMYFAKIAVETNEDSVSQAMQQNAENCRKIALFLASGEWQ